MNYYHSNYHLISTIGKYVPMVTNTMATNMILSLDTKCMFVCVFSTVSTINKVFAVVGAAIALGMCFMGHRLFKLG